MTSDQNRPEHIHMPGDGRGPRVVHLYGQRISHVVYADTQHGICRHLLQPLEIDPETNEFKWLELHGRVEVKPMEVVAP